MRVSNIRGGRLCRIALCCCIILPLIFLLVTWGDTKRGISSYHGKFARFNHQRLEGRPREVPKLVEGE